MPAVPTPLEALFKGRPLDREEVHWIAPSPCFSGYFESKVIEATASCAAGAGRCSTWNLPLAAQVFHVERSPR